MRPQPVVIVTQAEFDALLEYSWSTPTGTTIGTRWKRMVGRGEAATWWLGEYVADPQGDPTYVGIRWRELFVK